MKRPARLVSVAVLVLSVIVAASSPAQQTAAPPPAVPGEPIAMIIDAFRTHNLVALGEPHGSEQAHAFRLSLIRDPRFAAIVDDIVVECGSARYQDIIDRFVRGEDVPERSLRQVWQNTTVPTTVWDIPIYEEFFRAVRAVNASLPGPRRLRVLLGDPPIDWQTIRTYDEVNTLMNDRDVYPADLIRREVIAKGRRALLIFGDLHFQRKNLQTNYVMTGPLTHTIVSLLETTTAQAKVFTITTNVGVDLPKLQADVVSWKVPSLAILRGTVLGALDFTTYYSFELPRVAIRDGKPDFRTAIPRDQWRSLRMEDQFDAILYLGPTTTMTNSRLSPALCADPDYMEMRLGRLGLMPGSMKTPTGGMNPAEQLKQYCATVTAK